MDPQQERTDPEKAGRGRADPEKTEPKSRFDQISTRWQVLRETDGFVLRYGLAIRRYLEALLRDPHDAEDVAQEFILRVMERGFEHAAPDRGRFRNYLKVAVRNAALSHLRKKRKIQESTREEFDPPAPDPPALEAEWVASWRRCVLDGAWRALDQHERGAPGNLSYTVLRLAVDHRQEDSKSLAARVERLTGKPFRADAFRKQLSRARRRFAELIIEEVKQALEDPTPERTEEELIELGLMEYVKEVLEPGA